MTAEENERDAKDRPKPDEQDDQGEAAERAEQEPDTPAGDEAQPSREPKPLDLEPPVVREEPTVDRSQPPEGADEEAPAGVHALDVCPNCGSTMRGPDTLVCMRCGFDLKTMKVIETKMGETTADEEGKPKRDPLVREGPGDRWLPLTLAIIGGVILLIGQLAGAAGLFPELRSGLEEGETLTIPWAARWEGAGQLPVFIGLWTMCGFGALIVGAWLFGRPLGHVGLAALRMLGIVAIARCVGFISIPLRLGEFLLESLLAGAAFFALTVLLFRMKPRDAGTVLVVTIVLFLALFVIGHLVTWVT